MVYTLEQIQRGAAKYIDDEFTRKLTGIEKWAFGGVSSLAILRIGDYLAEIKRNKYIQMLGVIHDDGTVDVDTLYTCLKAEAEKATATFTVPIIGTTTLSASDVDKLYDMIKSS